MNELKRIEDLVRSFNWNEPSWSLFIVAGWLAFAVFYALASGRGRSLSLLMSVYVAKLLSTEMVFLEKFFRERFSIDTLSLSQLAVFGVVCMVCFLIFSKYGFKAVGESRGVSAIFVVIFSVLQVGLLWSSVLLYLPVQVLEKFSPLVRYLFIQQGAQVVWLVLPLIFLVIFGKFVASRQDV